MSAEFSGWKDVVATVPSSVVIRYIPFSFGSPVRHLIVDSMFFH